MNKKITIRLLLDTHNNLRRIKGYFEMGDGKRRSHDDTVKTLIDSWMKLNGVLFEDE